MDRQQLLAIVIESWQTLDGTIEGLDESALAEPNVVGPWSVAEVLGHVTAWDQRALQDIEQWQRGEPLRAGGGATVDQYNAAEAERRRGWSLAQIREEHLATRQSLREAIEALSDADWNSTRIVDGQTRSLGDIVAGDLNGDGPGDHAAEHAHQIQAWHSARQAPGAASA
jgi:hypothetical protein